MRLNGKLLPFLAAAAIAIFLLGAGAPGTVEAKAAGAGVSASVATQRVKLGLNKSVVIDLPSDAYDILVANPAVADAVTRTARRIYLFGKTVGETNIFVFGPNGEQIVSLDLAVERDVAGLEDYLKRFIPSSQIKVELLNDNVVLTGMVDTPLDSKRAVDLATIFVSGGEATTGQYSQTAAGGSVNGGVDINNPDQERRTSKIVNLLQIIGDDQVTLKVTVAEVSRSVMKQLGVNMFGSGESNGISWMSTGDNPMGLGKPLSNSGFNIGSSSLQAYVNAMEQSGVMKTLAEPTLTAVSGEKATFRVGGEYNIVSSQAITDPDITKGIPAKLTYQLDKVDYGIGLEFQPVVLSAGRISLKVRTAVSEPTTEGSAAFSTGSKNVPAANILSIRKRLADTTVELPSGGSMMIAGLVRDDVRQAISQFPGLGKIPVLGTLFRSRDFVRNESELIIIITPYLTRPVARNDLAKPDDNFNAASDGAGMFLGRVNRVYGTMQTDRPAGRYHGVVGFIYK
ncbi:type II and III secretion system protein family protein [Mesorhizobium sp. ESP-6-4]|uniref:type II and III secretion system protein family protein n=1 Tax=unclassified Mesorhizobium TaxID=325217 RepID=UPI001CCD3A93|nr:MULTISPECIES: type II and III secretion system protein family protein [unclassified Mesorhizobium]MBZ9659858.1 type II and III secretion system protein family protein [Mesorhizobium sp. ESP-6-4]MBZ9770531.1 type II and III secretion system protein family protein [Mesorhizobium sp. CA6]MBZ9860951.1 type II and III secretion system protein family protein [Mesorhizobium sp. CA12]